MNSLKLRKSFAAAGISLAALLSSYGASLAQEAVFVMATNEVGAPTYNPIKASNLNIGTTLIFDRLISQDADLSFHPWLAESWEEAADGMSWIFHLKKGVKFHNGEPFNAETIVKWLDLFKASENAYMTEAIQKVEVVDDTTVKFVMSRPEPNLLYNFSSSYLSVIEPKSFVELGDNYGVTEVYGTGPFKLDTFTVGQETVLVRNDDYAWASPLAKNRGPAKIAKLTLREIAEDSTAFLELKSGGVDMLLGVPTDFLSEVKAGGNLAVVTLPGQDVAYMPINVTKEPFTDVRVREAAAKAINQKEILDSIYGGVGEVANTFLISALPESKVEDKYRISYDPERSNSLLDEAGWAKGADGIRSKDGKPLKVSLWTQSDSSFRRLTEVIQAELKAVGIDSEITTFDSSAIRDQYKSGTQQLAVRSYNWDNADIIDWFFGGDRLGYPNVSMFNDPKAEELRKKAMTGSKNMAERISSFKAYHEYVLSQFPMAPIYQPVTSVGYNKDRLVLPAEIHAPSVGATAIMDIEVKE
ncbi:ABC transporter substrate-binding protein [Rhizobium sp. S95]|uniref:ABC transporter substrate-binding protein n=1 Tax=Ciceribacter sichuanensis TaxID=2949647 RepID=A0AAJ1C0J0_9HYPH|nr:MULTISPECIES: ABC transporter substrate-binding protein [unclassified Ciceribacter]MCM2395908.1 ABC transporter substrate-binding protein [Ciceribacter sp. S95]MCO5959577.1 ABC transporter substrate-binding protein [Ciceribacter sp. S101]